jgi:hypothetical protein
MIVPLQIRPPDEIEKRETPFFALADLILSRQGSLIAAIESIHRRADCFAGDILCVDPA